jgi:hypothetical protein
LEDKKHPTRRPTQYTKVGINGVDRMMKISPNDTIVLFDYFGSGAQAVDV